MHGSASAHPQGLRRQHSQLFFPVSFHSLQSIHYLLQLYVRYISVIIYLPRCTYIVIWYKVYSEQHARAGLIINLPRVSYYTLQMPTNLEKYYLQYLYFTYNSLQLFHFKLSLKPVKVKLSSQYLLIVRREIKSQLSTQSESLPWLVWPTSKGFNSFYI